MAKKIGIMTNGGDCPGLNAALRAVTLSALQREWHVVGIHGGSRGLDPEKLSYQALGVDFVQEDSFRQAGTILGGFSSGRESLKFDKKNLVELFVQGYKKLGLDALVLVTGDGSLRVLKDVIISQEVNIVAIPKTIDNDVNGTDRCIGFSTAVNMATKALDTLATTARSHDRIFVLEVMGRDAGHIALNAGIAGGADAILVPERAYDLHALAIHLESKKSALVVVSESIQSLEGKKTTLTDDAGTEYYYGAGQYIATMLQKILNRDTRFTTLGHLQRGGTPTAEDRLLSTCLGEKAVALIAEEKFGVIVGTRGQEIICTPIPEIIKGPACLEPHAPLFSTAKNIGIYIGVSREHGAPHAL